MATAAATTTTGVARDARRSLLRSAARGAGLVGLAVILGIVLLRVVDDGTSGPAGNGGGGGGGATTEPTDENGTEETLPTGGREPSEVRVVVFNAGQPSGSAMNVTNQLRGGGYNVGTPANATERIGVAVQCKEGFETEASQLVLAVGGGEVEPYDPAALPEGYDDTDLDCFVLLGQT